MEKIECKIPRFLYWLLKRFYVFDFREGYAGDIEEEFEERVHYHGKRKAMWWIWIHMMAAIPEAARSYLLWGGNMFRNYLKVALRNIQKHKGYSFINIIGLAVGMSVCILLMLFIQDELSYDQYHTHADHTYRLLLENSFYHAPQLAELLQEQLPEIEQAVRFLPRDQIQVRYQEKMFMENRTTYADAYIFKLFDFEFKEGNPETALDAPFSIVITEEMAYKYFSTDPPMGKTLRISNEHDYTVTGVLKEIPHNTHFHFDFFLTLTDAKKFFSMMDNWRWRNFWVYIMLKEQANIPDVERKMADLIAEKWEVQPDEPKPDFRLHSIKKIHLYSTDPRKEHEPQGSIQYVIIFSAIAVLILIIGCFNYLNLVTANATIRAKEVGIKKVAGATRKQLVEQFIGESLIQFGMALMLSILFIAIVLPSFNGFTGKQLSLSQIFSSGSMLGVVSILLVTVLLAGAYPALLLSAFQPVRVIKGLHFDGSSKSTSRRILVVFQFTISTILIISAMFMSRQVRFLYNSNPGFDKDFILIAEYHERDNFKKYEMLKAELMKHSQIVNVTSGSRFPSGELNNYTAIYLEGHEDYILTPIVHMGDDYFETFGIQPLYGRLFDNSLQSDKDDAIILNEAAVKQLGFHEGALGKEFYLTWPKSNRTVIGVVKDFHFESLYEEIEPAVFVVHPPLCWQMAVKLRPQQIQTTIGFIEKNWKAFYPGWSFEYKFVDQRYAAQYQKDKRTFQLMGYFTFLAIFIAALGLFGLASFSTKRRVKEVGMRKVLGSSLAEVTILLTKDYLKWVTVSFFIACPIAWVAMNKWLQNFAYRIEITIWPFFLAGLAALFIASFTVCWQTIRAARTNPVECLKYE